MNPVFLDLHIHTSDDPNKLDPDYDLTTLISKINGLTGNSPFLISFTDHNTINEATYLKAISLGINIVAGVELHIRNYDEAPPYHCHIYFRLPEITGPILKQLNKKLDDLYKDKRPKSSDIWIPKIDKIITAFDEFDFLLLPHGGQSHSTFDTSIPDGVKFDSTIERGLYYNQFDGFTARGNSKLEKTQQYFKKLGIYEFVNLVTCTDNYVPANYPKPKMKDPNPFVPTWMLAEPTFDGLRLSLSESSRLIYSTTKPKLWSERIRSVKHKKKNIDIDVSLSQGLNVVIGGSSSGKTLLVDTIHRCICNDFEDSNYHHYEIDKCTVDNPSGVTPHYLSQNYILNVVNDKSIDGIDSIEIIRNVFPGDTAVIEKINHSLQSIKRLLHSLLECVKKIEVEEKALRKIPVLSRLILNENVDGNVFEKMMPTNKEKQAIAYTEQKHDEHTEVLDEIEMYLQRNPFIKHDKTLVPKLKQELSAIFQGSEVSEIVTKIISGAKSKLAGALKDQNREEQSKQQHFEAMLDSINIYASEYKKFKGILQQIASFSVKVESEEIESMGHKLFIENSFRLDKVVFLESVNKYLKSECKISKFSDIAPELLFETRFKKQMPKVNDYADFAKKVYKDVEDCNKKIYRITTNDGRDFHSLSAGWKTSVILDLILGYDKDMAPVIIDQPEDNLATTYINTGLVSAIKKIKTQKQIILVSHNATIPMLADAQNIVLCSNVNNKIVIRSASLEGVIDGKPVLDHIAEITDGGKPSIKKRVKKYNLKNFKESV